MNSRCSAPSFKPPQCLSTFFRLTPVQRAVPMAPSPHLIAFLAINHRSPLVRTNEGTDGALISSSPSPGYSWICSILRVPEHCIVTTAVCLGNKSSFFKSFKVNRVGLLTIPPMSKQYSSSSMRGMPPWLRTKWSSFRVRVFSTRRS